MKLAFAEVKAFRILYNASHLVKNGYGENKNMNTIGRHLLAEFYDCDSGILNDPELIRQNLLDTARHLGVTIVGEVFHRFASGGVSGVLVITESHLSIHTWPESCYAASDIYTCSGLDPAPGILYLASSLKAKQYRAQEILRGLPIELSEHPISLTKDAKLITQMTPIHKIAQENPIKEGHESARRKIIR